MTILEDSVSSSNSYRLRIEADVLDRYRAYACLVVYIDGIDNTGAAETSEALLRQAEGDAVRRFGGAGAADHPHIAAWRAAYQGFGAKPQKHLCSAEALLSRVLRQEPLPSINTIVNLYNTLSIETPIPIGGEDRDKLNSDLALGLADGTEPFDTRRSGESVIDRPDAGEVFG